MCFDVLNFIVFVFYNSPSAYNTSEPKVQLICLYISVILVRPLVQIVIRTPSGISRGC